MYIYISNKKLWIIPDEIKIDTSYALALFLLIVLYSTYYLLLLFSLNNMPKEISNMIKSDGDRDSTQNAFTDTEIEQLQDAKTEIELAKKKLMNKRSIIVVLLFISLAIMFAVGGKYLSIQYFQQLYEWTLYSGIARLGFIICEALITIALTISFWKLETTDKEIDILDNYLSTLVEIKDMQGDRN